MSVSLVSNAYLDENSSKIRSKPVPWEVSALYFHFVIPTHRAHSRDTSVPISLLRRNWF